MTAIDPEFNLQSYDFDLPEAQIAQDPTEKRGASRLLVLDRETGGLGDAMFADLPDLLPPGALLVVNNTKVLPARLIGRKESGGRVEFLLRAEAQFALNAEELAETRAETTLDSADIGAVEPHRGAASCAFAFAAEMVSA